MRRKRRTGRDQSPSYTANRGIRIKKGIFDKDKCPEAKGWQDNLRKLARIKQGKAMHP